MIASMALADSTSFMFHPIGIVRPQLCRCLMVDVELGAVHNKHVLTALTFEDVTRLNLDRFFIDTAKK